MSGVRPEPSGTRSSDAEPARRSPKRSINAAAKGAVSPWMARLRLTAPLVVARGHQFAANVTAATHQARWTPRVWPRRWETGRHDALA